MSSFVTGVLKLTFGMILTKARDHAASVLTDDNIRDLIVREQDDIKRRLNGQAQANLVSSTKTLEEGLILLNISIDTSSNDESKPGNSREAKGAATSGENSVWPSALSVPMNKLKITNQERFQRAIDLFKSARDKATDAFSNVALGMESRIMATRLRVISRILEDLKDPDAAAILCISYLKNLHQEPAIRDMFSLHLGSGRFLAKRVYKMKRCENVLSVSSINFVLFDFTRKFTTEVTLDLFKWPTIEYDEKEPKLAYHPLLPTSEILEDLNESKTRTTNQMSTSGFGMPLLSVVNSKRELITWDMGTSINALNTCTGEIRVFCTLSKDLTKAATTTTSVFGIAIDKEDNVLIVVQSNSNYDLIILDTKGNLKDQCPLAFLNGVKEVTFTNRLDLSNEGNIIIHRRRERKIWICDQHGLLIHSFSVKSDVFVDMCVSDQNEIIVAPQLGKIVYVYTEEGLDLKRKFQVAVGHQLNGVAFNHATRQILVSTKVDGRYMLTVYSTTGEKQDTLQLPDKIFTGLHNITSHPSYPIALVHGKGVLIIQ